MKSGRLINRYGEMRSVRNWKIWKPEIWKGAVVKKRKR